MSATTAVLPRAASDDLRAVTILGTPVSIVTLPKVLSLFARWIADRRGRYVVVRDVHGVMRGRSESDLRDAHRRADLIVPDGVPLVWTARLAGIKDIARVCGPDLLPAVCAHGLALGWRHYFYGGSPDVLEKLTSELNRRFPGIDIVGGVSPPFRKLTADEDEAACAAIRAARADFVWVGLGTPKQETWMAEHRDRCGGAILIGVGAAFDMHAGAISRAPVWMQKSGLEWTHRLVKEPRRLWRRYLELGPQFLWLAAADLVRGRLVPHAVGSERGTAADPAARSAEDSAPR